MISKEDALSRISALVHRFEEQYQSYMNSDYNETLTRRDFIDPFFKALGWDVDNSQGYAEAYREVIHEDKVKVGDQTKAPDYSFRLSGGKRLFFVEAKKPSVGIKDNTDPAYQVRRYGWSAKLPISLVTDFEEFAIYDCTKKPNPNDNAAVARVKYLTYKDYIKEFDFIWNTFSKENVLKGSFDNFITGTKDKTGTQTVDKEFLISLDRWRTLLAESISKQNKELNEDELNFAVQQTIDRLIFLRIAEDRKVEIYGSLQSCLNSGDFYRNLLSNFREADIKYNSGLFDFKKDLVSDKINIDNKTIKTIINELYYPICPYEFSVLSVEILGSAYEQFLGKTISIGKYHKAEIEYKLEVRKAGGVYYTPQYIVDYIVRNTVGKILGDTTPNDVSKIKICDPACGSGSFLIGAYQYLLDWHKDYYTKQGKSKALQPDGNLTTAEKKRILLNNIYGVDLDVNAVEVTKLSLLLKCMEGETEASINQQIKIFKERVLPTLDDNIKCGNSLVQNSYLENELDFGLVNLKKVKPFDWQIEFKDIFNQGGFDIVIGNPPYSAKQSIENKYIASNYKTVEYKCDLFSLFIERGLYILREKGFLGYIIPISWMTNVYYKKLREYLIISESLLEINLIHGLVFESANVDTNIIILHKNSVKNKKFNWITSTAGSINSQPISRSYNQLTKEEGYSISIESDLEWYNLKKKIEKCSDELGKISKISLGMKLRSNNEFVVTEKSISHPDVIVFGKDIAKYQPIVPSHFFNFSEAVIVGGTKNPKIQQAKTKIFIQAIRNLSLYDRIIATLDSNSSYFIGTVNSVILNDDIYDYKYILGFLNSKLLNTYFKKRFTTISLTASFLGVLPIYKLITDEKKIIAVKLVKYVDELLLLNIEKKYEKLQLNISQLNSRINFCYSKIDELIYQLYDLTDEEIRVVEGK